MDRVDDYSYDLPEELIAQTPCPVRDESRLLDMSSGIRDRSFRDLIELVPADAVLVLNDTRVVRARLRARKDSGGAVELFAVEPSAEPNTWRCLGRSSKALRPGARLRIEGSAATAEVMGPRDEHGLLSVRFSGNVQEILEECGELPLPPYIERNGGPTERDGERYQTVFAKSPGAVAAPTAGLHFTPEVLDALAARGVTICHVTLHVGLGTFAPVRVADLADIKLHRERYHIPAATVAAVRSGRPVVAVGTTVVRALEAAAAGELSEGAGDTNLFISPGFQFRVVTHLLTNFHLPSSTLLMLVCAFGGYDAVLAAYRHAVAERYRFYSYGDAMFLSREGATREDG